MLPGKHLSFLLALALLTHCNKNELSEECAELCKDRCSAFEDCEFEMWAGCERDCGASLLHANCEYETPPDQLTCAELEEIYDCTDYCLEFCARAPKCGGFDQQLCLEGCTAETPFICNAASVPARTCDQLKPEARLYESAGEALASEDEGNVAVGYASPYSGEEYGLCQRASECDPPLACVLATNTCGACVADADCESGFGRYSCSNGACVEVACVTSDHCVLDYVCDPATHTCVGCLSDATCTGTYAACDVNAHQCVECTSDAYCDETFPRCDTEKSQCVECLSNADCTDPQRPVCGTSRICTR
jgi:hypothetical protein